MSPTYSTFGFCADVPVDGFWWRKGQELLVQNVRRVDDGSVMLAPDETLLVRAFRPGAEPVTRRVYPTAQDPLLFRKFADLVPTDFFGQLEFANTNGVLGLKLFAECDPTGPGKDFEMNPGAGVCGFATEFRSDWVRSSARLRAAVTIYDRHKAGDVAGIRQLLKWVPTDLPADYRAQNPQLSEGWHIDTHPSLPADDTQLHSRIREWVLSGPHLSGTDDPLAVAWDWLLHAINGELEGKVSPRLEIGRKGVGVEEHLAPRTLLAAMWSQLYQAVVGQKSFVKCPKCGRWLEVSRDEKGSTTRKQYCSDSCRVLAHRKRKERAVSLVAEGRTPKQVVAELAAEGIKADVSVVKKWVAASKKKGA